MHFLAMLAQQAQNTVVKRPSPWWLIAGFLTLAFAVYNQRKNRGKKQEQPKQEEKPERRKAQMTSDKKDAFESVAEQVADKQDKRKK